MVRGIAAVLAGAMVVATAGAAQAERFSGVKYLGSVKGIGPRTGTLAIESGQLRFEDDKGRTVFVQPLDAATAWVGSEKRTRFGRLIGNVALVPVLAPLTGGSGNPWLGGTRKDSPIVMVRNGADEAPPLRLRARVDRLPQIVDAINQAAARARTGRPDGVPAGSADPTLPVVDAEPSPDGPMTLP